MMRTYFYSFVKSNKVKVTILVLSLSLYFCLIAVAMTLHKSIPEIASLPLKSIGIQTIVQKTGKIPERMAGIIFPHSNAPITDLEIHALKDLAFVEDYDRGLYFWEFEKSSFKAVLGLDTGSQIIPGIVKNNIIQGSFEISGTGVLITEDYARKNNLDPGARVPIAGKSYVVRGILKPNMSGNIIPADIYMDIREAVARSRDSGEMQKLYTLDKEGFSNVILLRTDPVWDGDKEKAIRAINKDFLIFSEKTFSKEIKEQLKIISTSGSVLFIVLGTVLLIAFCLLIIFNLKTREKEIAILRMLGWKIVDLKKQFMGETLVLLVIALITGNMMTLAGLGFLRTRTISMELPWDISAKPHFLPQENNIERIVTANIPIHLDWPLFILLSGVFIGTFLVLNYALFYRLRKIKPYEMQGG